MIDSHQHFWAYRASEFSWVTDEMDVLQQDFLPPHLEKAMGETGVTGVIAVQARQTVEETEWLLELAERNRWIRGVVGWVPLEDPAVGSVLDRWGENGHFRGVREILQGAPDERYFTNPEFHRGMRELTSRGIPYDLLIFSHQLEIATRFVDAHPTQRFVLDHLAKPEIREAWPADWARRIGDIAQRQNVFCKFSGLVTEVREGEWNVERLRPYFETVLKVFGSKRLMFGSDWPVCLLRTDYAGWISAVQELAGELSSDECQAFFSGSAAAAYDLKE